MSFSLKKHNHFLILLLILGASIFLITHQGFSDTHPDCQVITLADNRNTITLYSDQRLEVDLEVPVSNNVPCRDNMHWLFTSNSTPRVLATESYVKNNNGNTYRFNDVNDDSLWSYESNTAVGTGCLSMQQFCYLAEVSSWWNHIDDQTTTTLTFNLQGDSVEDPPTREATFTINLIQVNKRN